MTTMTIPGKEEKDISGIILSLSPTTDADEITRKRQASTNGSLNASMSLTTEDSEFRTYKRRWLILALFVLYSTSNAFQWIQYAIINDVIVKFYNIRPLWVDWTSLIYMIVYIPLIFPATFLLQKKVTFTVL